MIDRFLEENGKDRCNALMIMDVDYFKQVNDTYGHMVGDKVLKIFGRLLAKQFREKDIVGRIGGDEFMVLMKDVSSRSVVELHMRRLCEEFRLLTDPTYPQISVSCSVGAAMIPDQGRSFEELYPHADSALYCAKHHGKDGWSIFSGESSC